MKKIASLIIVFFALVAVNLAWNALQTNTPLSSALAQPRFTPAAPVEVQSTVSQLPSSLAMPDVAERAQWEVVAVDQETQDDIHAGRMLTLAQAMREAGNRFPMINTGTSTSSSPQSTSEACMTMLANPQMDILKTGPTTGTVDSWVILAQNVYYDDRPGYYNSPSYSLVMVDDPGNDSVIISSTLDYDAFGQSFQAPGGLTSITINYSRLYTNANSGDKAFYNLWTVDSQGYLDQPIRYYSIGESPTGWSNRQTVITDSAVLAALSGQRVMFIFDMESDRQSPYEWIWLDDAQVQLCYATGPTKVYLPIVVKSPPQTGPTCTPYEPDNRDNRGNVTVGATCNGAFGPSDDKDYYTLDLAGVTDVKLRLFNLPPEGNLWDSAIYEYPYTGQQPACWIGREGLDKSEDCRGLNLNKTYFVLVYAGSAPSSSKPYMMSVTSLSGPPQPTPTPTPTPPLGPTPGFWSSTSGDEFYVSPDRANVLKFAIYIDVSQCGGTIKITRNTPAPISGNSFSFTGPFYASGTFDSSTSAHGTDGLSSFPVNIPGVCSVTITAGPWNWTATWKNSTQPTVINMEPTGPITVEFSDATSGSHTVSAVK